MFLRLLDRLLAKVRRRDLDREVDAELAFHLEMQTEANLARGMTPGEARRAARIALGGVDQTKEAVRDARWTWIDSTWQDVKFCARSLSLGFVVIAVTILALGFAITGAVFSTVNGMLAARVAIPHGDRLVFVAATENGVVTPGYFKESSYLRLFDRKLRTVRDLFATAPYPVILSMDGQSVQVRMEAVTGAYFQAIGVPPLLGRALHQDDDRAGSGLSVVLGESAWKRLFAGDARVIGRSIRLSGLLGTVVGVMPATVRGFTVAVVRPLLASPGQAVWGQIFGRLVDGASLRQAETEMRLAGSRFDPDDKALGAAVLPVERGVMPTRARLALGAVGTGLVALSSLVLLIACANLANLLLARGARRSSDVAIRMALGASPARILRLQLLETGSVTALGGAAGFALVIWASHLFGRFTIYTDGLSIATATLLVDVRVLAYFLVLVASASVAIGILPALRAIHIDPAQVLSSSGARGTATGRFERKRTLLVASQMAASTILLIVAGLFVQSALHASSYETALDTRHLAIGHFDVSTLKWNELRSRRLQETLLTAARTIPGVGVTALSTGLPAGGGGELVPIESEDWHFGIYQFGPPCRCLSVSPGFFEAVGPLHLRGRDFTARDTAGAGRVGIVNAVAASRLWPGRDPIGRRLRIRKEHALEVIGVVQETDRTTPDIADRCYVFVPMRQRYQPRFVLAVRGTGAAESLLGPLAATVERAEPDAAMFDVRTANAYLNRDGQSLRAVALALVVLGALGLTIAIVGLYGVMTYVVGLRRSEFGIRKVLGASDAQIYGLVVRDACRMLGIGILAGLPIAFIVSVLVARSLVGVTSHDATTYLLVPACLVAVGVTAVWWPAWRAARAEPLVALKEL
jgi:predicted permease